MHRRQKYVLNSEDHEETSCFSCFVSQESEASACQLWVKTGKEESPYPLIGEYSYIKVCLYRYRNIQVYIYIHIAYPTLIDK